MATELICAPPARQVNEYLEVHRELRVIPDGSLGFDPDTGSLLREFRDELVRRYAWAVPTPAAVRAIAARGPVVELGAGTGYWAALIEAAGGDVAAYDADVTDENPYTNGETWFEVRPGGVESLEGHQDRTLFLCWPPRLDPFAFDALAAYEGDTVCYVGEGWGGCTATHEFHELLHREFTYIQRVELPIWLNCTDDLSIWVRA